MLDKKEKKSGKFAAFMRAVFVNNIGLKIFAIVFSVAICLLVMGLKTRAITGGTNDGDATAPQPDVTEITRLAE